MRPPRRHLPLIAAALSCLLAAGCQNEPVNVTYEGFECPDLPGMDGFMEAADANNDNMLNSDEFNAAFEEAQDEVMPDGQLDRNELAGYVCAKRKAAAPQPQ
jgi:hypothetical protein